MTRKSRRELERALDELNDGVDGPEFDRDDLSLTPEEKEQLAERLSVDDVYDEADDWLKDLHERFEGESPC